MINTVIFDVGGVIHQGPMGFREKLKPRVDISLDEIRHQFLGQEMEDFCHGKLSEDEFWERLIKRHGWDVSVQELKQMVRELYIPVPGTLDLIKDLKAKKHKLGILSIHAIEWIEHIDARFPFRHLFDAELFSFEIGISKPDKRVYKEILRRLGSQPKECVFLDDTKENIDAADELGIKGLLFKDALQARDGLLRSGILL